MMEKPRKGGKGYCVCPIDAGGQSLRFRGQLRTAFLDGMQRQQTPVTLDKPCLLCKGLLQRRRKAGDSQSARKPPSQWATAVKNNFQRLGLISSGYFLPSAFYTYNFIQLLYLVIKVIYILC